MLDSPSPKSHSNATALSDEVFWNDRVCSLPTGPAAAIKPAETCVDSDGVVVVVVGAAEEFSVTLTVRVVSSR